MTASIKSNATSAELLVNGISQLVIDNTTPPTTANPQGAGANELARKDYVDGIAIGVGQTWQNLTASRSFGTTYTNNTGRPIQVSISSNESVSQQLTLTVSGVLIMSNTFNGGTNNGRCSVTGIIPAGATYAATAYGTVALDTWAELR